MHDVGGGDVEEDERQEIEEAALVAVADVAVELGQGGHVDLVINEEIEAPGCEHEDEGHRVEEGQGTTIKGIEEVEDEYHETEKEDDAVELGGGGDLGDELHHVVELALEGDEADFKGLLHVGHEEDVLQVKLPNDVDDAGRKAEKEAETDVAPGEKGPLATLRPKPPGEGKAAGDEEDDALGTSPHAEREGDDGEGKEGPSLAPEPGDEGKDANEGVNGLRHVRHEEGGLGGKLGDGEEEKDGEHGEKGIGVAPEQPVEGEGQGEVEQEADHLGRAAEEVEISEREGKKRGIERAVGSEAMGGVEEGVVEGALVGHGPGEEIVAGHGVVMERGPVEGFQGHKVDDVNHETKEEEHTEILAAKEGNPRGTPEVREEEREEIYIPPANGHEGVQKGYREDGEHEDGGPGEADAKKVDEEHEEGDGAHADGEGKAQPLGEGPAIVEEAKEADAEEVNQEYCQEVHGEVISLRV